MRYFCLVLALIAGLAYSQKSSINPLEVGYIRVLGVGKTFDEAKNDAFKNAVNMIVGSALLSELEVNNNTLTRDDIVNYSAGYVDRYEVVERIDKGNKITLIVDVVVKNSKIADRVLNRGKDDKVLEGDRLATQYNTYLTEQRLGDIFLSKILNDYPKKAFILSQGKTEFRLDKNRNSYIVIPFELKWSYPYLVAINEVLAKLEDGNWKAENKIVVISKDPNVFLIGNTSRYLFNDSIKFSQLQSKMSGNVKLRTTIFDGNNNSIYSACFTTNYAFAGTYSKGVFILYGNTTESDELHIPIIQNSSLNNRLDTATKIEVTIGC